jgi:hypothetical protein
MREHLADPDATRALDRPVDPYDDTPTAPIPGLPLAAPAPALVEEPVPTAESFAVPAAMPVRDRRPTRSGGRGAVVALILALALVVGAIAAAVLLGGQDDGDEQRDRTGDGATTTIPALESTLPGAPESTVAGEAPTTEAPSGDDAGSEPPAVDPDATDPPAPDSTGPATTSPTSPPTTAPPTAPPTTGAPATTAPPTTSGEPVGEEPTP